jgi:hypothetical protein
MHRLPGVGTWHPASRGRNLLPDRGGVKSYNGRLSRRLFLLDARICVQRTAVPTHP